MDEEVRKEQLAEAQPTHIVAIGASAGGLEALERFVESLTTDAGVAYVIIQHLSPDFASLMDQVLARHTIVPIVTAQNEMVVKPNTIYLMPQGKNMQIVGGRLMLSNVDRKKPLNLPIDEFFSSLADDYGDKSVAIVLSGTGSDGSRGVKSVHEAGGLVIAQTAASSGFDTMPNNAVATGVVDLVLAPEHMPRALMHYCEKAEIPTQPLAQHEDPVYGHVFALLREHYGIDFNYYKLNTVARRIERRMTESRVDTMSQFVEYLEANPEELDRLYYDLLIGVTAFFRDPKAWEYLEQELIPELINRASRDGELRIWTPGCASGEEVFSLAILIREALAEQNLDLSVKIFATDVHQRSLDFAANSIYPEKSLLAMPQERIEAHFIRDVNGYIVRPEVRGMVVFARQDVTRDPPFTRVHMVICRNLLIYLDAEAQHKALSMFHFAMRKGGFMFLGPSESLGDLTNEFVIINSRLKIFEKRTDKRIAPAAFRLPAGGGSDIGARTSTATIAVRGSLAGRPAGLIRAYDILMDEYMPPSILVSASGEVAHTFGEARKYLQPQKGVASLYVSEMILSDLRLAVVSALQKAQKETSPTQYRGLKVKMGDAVAEINMVVRALSAPSSGIPYVLLSFEESKPRQPLQAMEEVSFELDGVSQDRIKDLELELRYTKEHLQSAVEDLETSNEELQATNEELMAANEELQSTNEELHSVNEELYTVNREYEEKIAELTELTSDVNNLLTSTEIGTLFLDLHLRIRKFTPAAARQFNLLDHDIGRPIAHLHKQIDYPEFNDRLAEVLTTAQRFETDVRDKFGHSLLMRINPYRDMDDEVSGVVVTFVDVERLMQASKQLQMSHEELQEFAYAVSHDLQEPIRVVSAAGSILEEEIGGEISPDAARHLRYAIDGSERAVRMIRGLLEFSRVRTRGGELEACSAEKACAVAIEALRPEIEKRAAKITISGLPHLTVDRDQLVQVFHHLLENAIRLPITTPKITVSSEVNGEFATISIADNGPGIPEEDKERVFRVFSRLGMDRDADESGIGIGLPVCRRIVQRHGGKIWIDSRIGQGTTVSFTMPCVTPDSSEKLGRANK